MRKFARIAMSLLAMGAWSMPVAAAEFNLKASHSAANTEPYQTGLQTFADRVRELSGGRVEVTIYPNNQLGNEKEVLEGLLLGTVDFAVTANGVLGNFVPSVGIFDLPFLFRDREHLYKVMDGPVGDQLKADVTGPGFHLLAFYEAGIRHLLTKTPVESIGDLANLKIRTMQVPAHISAFKAFGANPTPMAYGELYGAIQSGVVDGAEAANSNYYAQKFFEVAPNYAQISWTALVAELLMSETRLKSFPEEIQQAILQAAAESANVERKAYADADGRLLNELIAKGVKVTYPDVAPFRTASQGVYEEFVTTPEQKQQLETILTTK
ncbi:TRAP transporter substrate-binding protein [Pararhizobium sp. LjRoot238]|uniref:TRAP transporter substrate-binding protein n=1 Tax=Pararhizobium sp. LjRoot238 TaxID=3342293 RepID=UPI003ED0DD77